MLALYKWLWKGHRRLLVRTLVLAYGVPIALELLPWWASPRRLSLRLRALRITVAHRMAVGRMLDRRRLIRYTIMALWHAGLRAFLRRMVQRVDLQARQAVRRFVLEHLLYAEVAGAPAGLPAAELGHRVEKVVSEALSFVHFTVPALLGSAYAVVREARELPGVGAPAAPGRGRLDWLVLLQPLLAQTVQRGVGALKWWLVDVGVESRALALQRDTSALVATTVDGLVDVQAHNLQERQLAALDEIAQAEMHNFGGTLRTLAEWFGNLSRRNLFEFVFEVVVVHAVMQRQGFDHGAYLKLQVEIDRLFRLVGRVWGLASEAGVVWQRQREPMGALMQIPVWSAGTSKAQAASITTAAAVAGLTPLRLQRFREIRIRKLFFRYPDGQVALRLGTDPPPAIGRRSMVFRPGVRYAVVGPNRSGKSTLCRCLLRLQWPEEGAPVDELDMHLDGVAYELVPRRALRSIVAYVAQRPFLFPGTIAANIRVGNADASDDEIAAAAAAAGVFFDFGIGAGPGAIEAQRQVLARGVEAGAANLNGGTAQSIALARVYVRRGVRVVVLDEAFSAQDVLKKRTVVLPNLLRFVAKHRMALIMVGHEVATLRFCDVVYVMDEGRLVASGSWRDVAAHPSVARLTGVRGGL